MVIGVFRPEFDVLIHFDEGNFETVCFGKYKIHQDAQDTRNNAFKYQIIPRMNIVTNNCRYIPLTVATLFYIFFSFNLEKRSDIDESINDKKAEGKQEIGPLSTARVDCVPLSLQDFLESDLTYGQHELDQRMKRYITGTHGIL
jgi:hypothetical protein